MDHSNYLGEQNNMGSSSGSSSRKGKKNNQDKPKQPQRGLGVAQLEKIRLHGQMAYGSYHPHPLHAPYPSSFNNEDPRVQTPYSTVTSSSSFSYSSSSTSYTASHGFQPNIVMGPEYERTNIRFGDSQTTNPARWEDANNATAQPNITRPLLSLYDTQGIDTKKRRSGSSSSQNSESSDTQEPDLELRLSL